MGNLADFVGSIFGFRQPRNTVFCNSDLVVFSKKLFNSTEVLEVRRGFREKSVSRFIKEQVSSPFLVCVLGGNRGSLQPPFQCECAYYA